MSHLKTIRSHFFALFIVALFIVFAFWDLPNTFFLQDEWETFAVNINYQSKGFTGIVESLLPVDPLSHFNPLSRVFSLFEYVFYYTNFVPYAWQSIALHILNALLLYYFIYAWLKDRKIAFTAGLFFGLNSIPSQAVTWVAAANSYEVPMALILISLIFFNRFTTQKDNKRGNLIISLTILLISFLFHENGLFLFFFYPLTIFFFAKTQKKKLLLMLFCGIFISIAVFTFIRIPFLFGFTVPASDMTGYSHPPLTVYPFRLISMGIKSFSGSFIPEKTLIDISDKVVRLAYPQFLTADNVPNPFIVQSIVFDLVSYVLAVVIICLFVLFKRVIKGKKILDAFVWAILFIPMSISPYIFVLGKAGYASIIESKFFYIGNIGVSILVGIIVYSAFLKLARQRAVKIFFCILFGVYLLSHGYEIKTYLDNLEKVSLQRKMFLGKIQASYPDLPDNVMFFIQSDTAYYGMPSEDKILPVQVGIGRMLLVWYQKDERFPGCLFTDQFLLSLVEEGYRFCDGRGFGYFRSYDKLEASVRANNIRSEEIIAYSWEGRKGKFTDITEKIRSMIKQDTGKNK